jgi:hypothetical protein
VDPSRQVARFRVRVHTSALPEAGTSARVHLALHGSQGVSQSLPLRGSFQRGCVDECELSCRDVGDVRCIRIGHDNWGGCRRQLMAAALNAGRRLQWTRDCRKLHT